MDLETVADELYALQPDEFTPVRNERAKQARADGDKDLAEQIRRLEKPTTSAWLVNRLARERAEELEPLIELGRDLREAAADIGADELRELTRQRHRVVNALVQQARQLGAAHGTKVSDSVAGEVQQTLDASLSDPDVADDVLAGRLTHAQAYAGFGAPMGGDGATRSRRSTTTRSGGPKASTGGHSGKGKQARVAEVTDLTTRRRESAQRALDEADRALDEARSRHEEAAQEQEEAAAETRQARETVDRLRAELDSAEERARDATRSERSTRHNAERTEEALDKAERARERAAAKLAEASE